MRLKKFEILRVDWTDGSKFTVYVKLPVRGISRRSLDAALKKLAVDRGDELDLAYEMGYDKGYDAATNKIAEGE